MSIFTITLDFDSDLKQVSNINICEHCDAESDSEFKTTTTFNIGKIVQSTSPTPKKSKAKKSKNEDIIKLEDNKLVLTKKLVDLIGAEPGDRLLVTFKEFNGSYYPVISKSEVYADAESGNKLTKSLTMSYKGKQREQLEIYGTEFTFELFSPVLKACKLIGEKEIKPDNKVTESNTDVVTPFEEEVVEDTKKTYSRELKTPIEINFDAEEDFNITEDDLILEEINEQELEELFK